MFVKRYCPIAARVAMVGLFVSGAQAAEPGRDASGPLHFTPVVEATGFTLLAAQDNSIVEQTEVTSVSTEGYTLGGPYFLRSADPEPPGEMELKFIYGWETGNDGSDDHDVAIEFEWGIVENVEFILEAEATLGDGRVEGNGDIEELGFHTRFWEENGWAPAFAMRNLVRLPTGYHSSGVDYLGIGLFTWTLDPGATRLHFNPFVKSVNGDNDDDARDFQWGAALGIDHRVSDDLLIIFDYKHTASEEYGARNNHSIEFGGEWEFAPHQELGFGTEIGIDGDDHGPNFAARLSYILEIG